jgi:hypothetical protein
MYDMLLNMQQYAEHPYSYINCYFQIDSIMHYLFYFDRREVWSLVGVVAAAASRGTYSTYPTNLYTPKSRPRNNESIQPPHPQWYPQKPDQPSFLLITNRYHLHNRQSFPLHNIVDVVPTKTKR